MDSDKDKSSLDIVFSHIENKQISKISQELLQACKTELVDKWNILNSVCEKEQNISVNKQSIEELLARLVQLTHETRREISRDLHDLYLTAKEEYEYLKTYSELAGRVMSSKANMETRNPKIVPKSVSQEDKMLSAKRSDKTDSSSKSPKVMTNSHLSNVTDLPGPEEQGPDYEEQIATIRDTQRLKTASQSNNPGEGPATLEMVRAGNASEKSGILDANSTNYMNQNTSLSNNSGPSEMSEVYESVYKDDWNNIFSGVKKKNSERQTIEFLKEILKASYCTSLENANSQIELMMKEAMNVVCGEKNPIDKANVQGDVELLKEYRRINSVLSLPYLKQNLFETKLKDLQRGISLPRDLVTSKYLQTFVSKCVEITWFISIHDPPMVLEFDFKPKDEGDLNQAVTSFKPGQNGKRLQYIVWPPLRRNKGGPVISKGVAVLK